jgi:glycosyltransferase involved in cell wall biosynthesis
VASSVPETGGGDSNLMSGYDGKKLNQASDRIRVVYSFPHKLGAQRICYTAWQQVNGLAAAGADVLAFPGVLHRPVPPAVRVKPTLALGKLRISYRMMGKMRALALHDYLVARRIRKLAGQIDIIHLWPDAALRTIKAAKQLGITTVLERPNAHTRFAYEVVRKETDRLGVTLPPGDEYFYREDVLEKEEKEFGLADYLLCPSEFVAKTFVDQGIPREKLLRHQYGFDEKVYYADTGTRDPKRGLTVLFVGVCAVRKGVHFALEAWLNSPAHRDGTFMIAGKFLPAYAEKIQPLLSHPSVRVLGHRSDVPELMRSSDIFVLPSLEEGFPLVVAEAMGSGCVALVSDSCDEICRHMETGLIHRAGDVQELIRQFTMLHENRDLLEQMRRNTLRAAPNYTWDAAGVALLSAYREALSRQKRFHASPVGLQV